MMLFRFTGDNMEGCIFCKLVKGEIPSSKVYEDDKILGFMDISPSTRGHVLVIPKEHYEILLDIPDDELSNLIIVVKKLSKAVEKGSNADGFIVSMNNRKPGGQAVPHAHFHIIPRYKDDGLKFWSKIEYKEGEMEGYKAKIVDSIE